MADSPIPYSSLTNLVISPVAPTHYSAGVRVASGPGAVRVVAAALAEGSLAIVPTETVYGLAADAQNQSAVTRIYQVKGRPSDHPLIVHVAGADNLDYWAVEIPDYARQLASAHWPGPMTLVLKRSDKAKDFITGNQDTVAVRVPAHPLTQAILREFAATTNNPHAGIAAPSANRFGRVSPTQLQHAVDELSEYLGEGDVGVDGGPSEVGIESTIIDCTGDQPRILRQGAVTIESTSNETQSKQTLVRAPGMLASHYAPHARVQIIDNINDIPEPTYRAGLIAEKIHSTPELVIRLAEPHDAVDYAKILYAALRQGDDNNCEIIYVIPPQGEGIAAAVRDRIQRAAHQ